MTLNMKNVLRGLLFFFTTKVNVWGNLPLMFYDPIK